MSATIATPDAGDVGLLPAADFCDSWSIDVAEPGLDAWTAAERAFTRLPAWVVLLMRIRDGAVALVGLKAAQVPTDPTASAIGGFPVVDRTPDRVVLSFDDRHLDFRIVVRTVRLDGTRVRVGMTTVVATHNRLGRLYLAAVLPFHRVIVPTSLRGIAGRA